MSCSKSKRIARDGGIWQVRGSKSWSLHAGWWVVGHGCRVDLWAAYRSGAPARMKFLEAGAEEINKRGTLCHRSVRSQETTTDSVWKQSTSHLDQLLEHGARRSSEELDRILLEALLALMLSWSTRSPLPLAALVRSLQCPQAVSWRWEGASRSCSTTALNLMHKLPPNSRSKVGSQTLTHVFFFNKPMLVLNIWIQ